MSQVNEPEADAMRSEYDIRGGVRGKYYERYQQGTNVVLLEPDVASVFPDSASVNRALRMLIDVARGHVSGAAGQQDLIERLQATARMRHSEGREAPCRFAPPEPLERTRLPTGRPLSASPGVRSEPFAVQR